MPGLPVPMFLTLVFGYLALRILLVRDRPAAFALLLGAVALQAVILSWPVLRPLQPVTATMLPPLAWIVFQVTAVRPLDPGRDLWHAVVPAFTLFVRLAAPMFLDVVIPAVYLAYALALVLRLRQGADSMPRLSLATGERPELVWRMVAATLVASAVGDAIVSLALLSDEAWLKPVVILVLTSGHLLAIGLLCLSTALAGPATPGADAEDGAEAAAASAAVTAADEALMVRLDALMTRERLYLDPDLTLARIARRLTLPAKQVSAAVNRVTGENVSRLVNGYRIRHAMERLAAGDGVTAAMLASGFNTKSNFNREFQRVTGTAPRHWAEADAARRIRADETPVPPSLRRPRAVEAQPAAVSPARDASASGR